MACKTKIQCKNQNDVRCVFNIHPIFTAVNRFMFVLACDHATHSELCWREFGSTSSPRKNNTTLEDSNGKRDHSVWGGGRLSNLQGMPKVCADPNKKVLHVLEIREFVWWQGSAFMDDHFRSVLCCRNLCMDGQYVNLPVPKQLDSLRRCLETTRYWGREPRIYGMIMVFSRKSV